jgi:transposase
MLSQMVEEIKSKKTQEEEINELLYTLTKSDELVQRMVEVPGVGLLTAVALVTTLEDPHRFKNAGDLSGFLGMVPREFSSGAKKRLGGITKAGPQLLRKYLIHGARATMRYRPSTEHKQRLWAEKLSQRSGVNKATVALARKTAIILWAMWRDETKYNEKKTEQKPEQKTEQKEIQRKVA